SGSLLAAGVAVRYAAVFHAVVIASGIVMVHLPQGWFTVGHGSGGMEYSVLILAVLGYVFTRKDQPSLMRRPLGPFPPSRECSDEQSPAGRVARTLRWRAA